MPPKSPKKSFASATVSETSIRVKSRVSPKKEVRSDETEEAVASIVEVTSSDPLNFTVATDGDAEWVPGSDDGEGDTSVEAVTKARAENRVATAEYTMEAIADNDIDLDAFEVRICLILRPRGVCSMFPVLHLL